MQQFQICEVKASYRAPLIPFWKLPASSFSFFFFICKIEYWCWPGRLLHWLNSKCKPRAGCKCLSGSLCGGKITCAACLADVSTGEQMKNESKSAALMTAKVNRSLLAGVFLGIMLGLGMGHQKVHSDCSLEGYRKPRILARAVRAEAFWWNHKWYGH